MTANSWQHSHALRRAEWPGQYSKNTMMVVESLGKPRWWRREIIRIISNPETSCNLSNQCLSSMVPLRKKGYSHPREPVLWTNMEECIKMPPKVDCSIHGDSMYLRSPFKACCPDAVSAVSRPLPIARSFGVCLTCRKLPCLGDTISSDWEDWGYVSPAISAFCRTHW